MFKHITVICQFEHLKLKIYHNIFYDAQKY